MHSLNSPGGTTMIIKSESTNSSFKVTGVQGLLAAIESVKKDLSYWKQKLSNDPMVLNDPWDRGYCAGLENVLKNLERLAHCPGCGKPCLTTCDECIEKQETEFWLTQNKEVAP